MSKKYALNGKQIAFFKESGYVVSPNAGNFLRYGLFGHNVPKQVETMKRDAPAGMWKYWGI